MEAFGRNQRDVADLRARAFDVKAAHDDRRARRVRAFQVPAQLRAAVGGRLESDLDEAGRIDVGRRVFPRIGNVLLLAGDRAKAGGHPHADRRHRSPAWDRSFGPTCSWMRSPSIPSVHLLETSKTVRACGSFMGTSQARSNCPLIPYASIRVPLRHGGRVNVRSFDRLDLAMLLRNAERDLASGRGGNRQLEVTLIELPADRHHERNDEFMQPLAAHVDRVAGYAVKRGRAEFAGPGLAHSGSQKSVLHADRYRQPKTVPFHLDVDFGGQAGPGSSSQDPASETELMLYSGSLRSAEFFDLRRIDELFERRSVDRRDELPVLIAEPNGVARLRSETG